MPKYLVGEVGDGAAVGLAVIGEGLRWNENRGDEAGGDEEDAHETGCGDEELPGIANASVLVGTGDKRHDRDACFKAGESQGQAREEKKADAKHRDPVWMLREECGLPI